MGPSYIRILPLAWLLVTASVALADETTTSTTVTTTTSTVETSTTSTTEPSTTSTTVLVTTTSTTLEPTTTSSSSSTTTSSSSSTSSSTSTSTSSTTSTSIQVCTCDDLPFMAEFAAKLSSGVVVDHDLGVNDAVGVAILAPGATMSGGTTLIAERVKIAPGANVYNVLTNELSAAPSSIHGSVGPVNPPLRANYCSLPSLTCGEGDLQVTDTEAILGSGNYGRVSVAAGAILHLPGTGPYRFCELRIANRAEVLVTHQVTIEVTGNVIVGTDSSFHTSGGAPFILRVGGPKLLLGRDAIVTAAITAPNAKGKVKAESHLQGCMCSRVLKAARDARLTCAGDASPSGAFFD